jgi:TRAP-type C4-dicarboxylate transport system permease small subunit
MADAVVAMALLATALAVFAQVICRYGLNQPISWLDEFAVLIFAWMIFVGAAVAQRSDSHVAINTLVNLLPGPMQRALYVIRCAAMAAVLGVLFWQGLNLTRRMSSIDYPAMGISRGFLYATLPVATPLIALYLARCLFRRLAGERRDAGSLP